MAQICFISDGISVSQRLLCNMVTSNEFRTRTAGLHFALKRRDLNVSQLSREGHKVVRESWIFSGVAH